MDQTITGSAGIDAGQLGDGSSAHIIQQRITGSAGITTGEAFSARSGVYVQPETIPYAVWVAI